MSRAARIATVVSGCLLLSVAGVPAQEAEAPPPSLSSEVMWGEPSNGWQFGLSLLNERVPVPWGEPIRVRVSLKNISKQSRDVQYGPLFSLHRCQLRRVREWKTIERRQVRTHRETLASPLTRYGRSLIEEGELGPLKSATLKPGQSLTQDLFLSRCFDMSQGGEHQLTIERLMPRDDALQVLKTPRVSIRVKEAGQIPIVTD